MPPQRKSEAEEWRDKADEAIRKFSKMMDFFLFATAQLVKLTEVHQPDDFNHCTCCKMPWPCQTMEVIQKIGGTWSQTQENIGKGDK